jgi:hypothetical protein
MALDHELSFNLGLPSVSLEQDPKLAQEFTKIYNAIKSVAYYLDRYTGALPPVTDDWPEVGTASLIPNGMFKVYMPAFEDLAVGNLVAFYNDAGTPKVRKSQSAVRKCHGFCSVAGLTGAQVEITLIGRFPEYPAGTLTPGTYYYNSATAGVLGAAGDQVLGVALTDTTFFFNPMLT